MCNCCVLLLICPTQAAGSAVFNTEAADGTQWFMRGSRWGGTGGPDPPPLKIHKNIVFLGNTGPGPL